MIALFNPVKRLDLVVKQFTDVVESLDDVIKDCDSDRVIIQGKIEALGAEKMQLTGAMERAMNIKTAIETNILGVK